MNTPTAGVRIGLRANAAQFTLLVAVNALVGGLLGQERTVLPLLAETEFGLAAYTAALTYILAFGATKAITNFFAGTLADRHGRKPVLVAGWLIGLPVPLLLIWAPSWGWVIAANVLLGVNQGLTWSITVIMKIDLAGPTRRGLAMGLNEAAGYLAVAGTALATGALAAQYGLRPAPFLLGLAYAALGLALSTLFVRETRGHARHEAANHASTGGDLSTRQVAALVSYREPALSSVSQAGLVNNLNDGLAWGLFPLLFLSECVDLGHLAGLDCLRELPDLAVVAAGQEPFSHLHTALVVANHQLAQQHVLVPAAKLAESAEVGWAGHVGHPIALIGVVVVGVGHPGHRRLGAVGPSSQSVSQACIMPIWPC